MNVIFEEISLRNPGALHVCFELVEAFGDLAVFDFALLREMGVLGCELWDLYKQCDCNIDKLHMSIIEQTAIQKLSTVRGSKFYEQAVQG